MAKGKFEIGQPGVFDKDGEELEIGTVIPVDDAEKIPASLVGKGRLLKATDTAEPVANAKTKKRVALEVQAEKLGVAFDDEVADGALIEAIKTSKAQ